MGLLEVPAVVLGAPIASVLSRRVVLGGGLCTAGIFMLLQIITDPSKS